MIWVPMTVCDPGGLSEPLPVFVLCVWGGVGPQEAEFRSAAAKCRGMA